MRRIYDFPGKHSLLFSKDPSGERHAHLTLFYCSPYARYVALLDAHLLPTGTARSQDYPGF